MVIHFDEVLVHGQRGAVAALQVCLMQSVQSVFELLGVQPQRAQVVGLQTIALRRLRRQDRHQSAAVVFQAHCVHHASVQREI